MINILLYQILVSPIYRKMQRSYIKTINLIYYVSDIQDYFEYIIKRHKIMTDNPPI